MPAEHGHETASHHAASHPGSAAEPLDAAAIVAPEETALEGASDSEPATATDEEDEKSRAEFRQVAERRVRLGLLLAEVGRNANITVSQEELNQALTQEARRHPGYERQVIDYYRNNPDALNNLRAPIFEEKVVDFIVELAKPQEKKVTPQELMTGAEAEDAEATETQVWVDFAWDCGYISQQSRNDLIVGYEEVGRMLSGMISNPKRFVPYGL